METIKVHIFANLLNEERKLESEATNIGGRFVLSPICYDEVYNPYPTSNWKPQFDTALHRKLKSREVLA